MLRCVTTLLFACQCVSGPALTARLAEPSRLFAPTLLLGVVIDMHAYQRRAIDFERTTLSSVLETFPHSRLFAVSCAERPKIAQDWTSVPSEMGQLIMIGPQSNLKNGASLKAA